MEISGAARVVIPGMQRRQRNCDWSPVSAARILSHHPACLAIAMARTPTEDGAP
jgi:hypothetical protein